MAELLDGEARPGAVGRVEGRGHWQTGPNNRRRRPSGRSRCNPAEWRELGRGGGHFGNPRGRIFGPEVRDLGQSAHNCDGNHDKAAIPPSVSLSVCSILEASAPAVSSSSRPGAPCAKYREHGDKYPEKTRGRGGSSVSPGELQSGEAGEYFPGAPGCLVSGLWADGQAGPKLSSQMWGFQPLQPHSPASQAAASSMDSVTSSTSRRSKPRSGQRAR